MSAITDPRTGHEDIVIDRLEYGSIGRRANGWWGMMMLITTETFLFLYLLFSYYYFLLQQGSALFPAEMPTFRLSAPSTIILIASSFVVWWAERAVKKGQRLVAVLSFVVAILMGIAFIGIQLLEWHDKPFRPDTSPYGSLYFTVTGFHMAHVVGGLIMLGAVTVWTGLNYFDSRRHTAVACASVYWHFVDVVWLTVFFTFYVTPYLG